MDRALERQAERVAEMLQGNPVATVTRHRGAEVCIEFDDGTRLFVDGEAGNIELSVTEVTGNAISKKLIDV